MEVVQLEKVSMMVERKTFNPDRNAFDIDRVNVVRDKTVEELQIEKKKRRGRISVALCYIFIPLIWAFGCLFLAVKYSETAVIIWCVSSLVVFILGLTITTEIVDTCKFKLQCYKENNAEKLWKLPRAYVDQYNKEQEEIATAWRMSHPVEEAARAFLEDPDNSVAFVRFMKLCNKNKY